MIIGNSTSYYPPQYGSAPFSTFSNRFPFQPTSFPSFSNAGISNKKSTLQTNSQKVPSFKLYDLEGNQQNDIIRWVLSMSGVPFKDKRLKPEEWEKQKQEMPFEELPILRVNHHLKIPYLDPIIRFLAREFHLYGTGKHDQSIVDTVIESVRRFHQQIPVGSSSDSNQVENLRQWISANAEKHFKQLEHLYQVFNRHGPFYLGSHLSIADLLAYYVIDLLVKVDAKVLDNYALLKQARARLESHPRLIHILRPKAKEKTKSLQRSSVKSPTANGTNHRRRSHEGRRSSRHSHHRHHHHHHHRRSKEATPNLRSKQNSSRPSKSPNHSHKHEETSLVTITNREKTPIATKPIVASPVPASTTITQTEQQTITQTSPVAQPAPIPVPQAAQQIPIAVPQPAPIPVAQPAQQTPIPVTQSVQQIPNIVGPIPPPITQIVNPMGPVPPPGTVRVEQRLENLVH